MKKFVFLVAVLPLGAGPIYTLVDIGGTGSVSAEAFSVNASGTAAGRAYDARGNSLGFAYGDVYHPFDAGSDFRAINSDGAVAGTRDGIATVWHAGGATAIGTLGGAESWGIAIDDLGYMTGGAQRAGGEMHAYLFANGKMIDLGTLGGSWSSGYAVSGGAVVGASEDATGLTRAFRWTAEAGMTRLSSPGESRAFALNAAGTVAGASLDRSGHYRAALWTSAGSLQLLPTLGGVSGFAYGINGNGQVVGYTYDSAGRQRAFLWTGSMLFDLNALVDAPGWELTAAYGINDSGQIVGTAEVDGRTTAFRLDPLVARPESAQMARLPAHLPSDVAQSNVPEPAALLLVAMGLVPFVIKRVRATVTRN